MTRGAASSYAFSCTCITKILVCFNGSVSYSFVIGYEDIYRFFFILNLRCRYLSLILSSYVFRFSVQVGIYCLCLLRPGGLPKVLE